jgi:hypothetical protein
MIARLVRLEVRRPAPGNSPQPPRLPEGAVFDQGRFEFKRFQGFKPPFNASTLASVKVSLERAHNGLDVAGDASEFPRGGEQGRPVVGRMF